MGNKQGILLKGIASLPLQIPYEILEAQPRLGVEAVLLWINLAAMANRQKPLTVEGLAAYIGLDHKVIEEGLATLADQGWINDEGKEIILQVPSPAQDSNWEKASQTEPVLDQGQASFEWLINFCAHRLAVPSPDEMQKLLFWIEKKELSHEVIAAAVEEMCATADRPHFGYLEGMLRNWYNEGVRSYGDLVKRPHLSKVLPCNGGQEQIHPEAKRRWKELFPDEFDD